MFNAAGCTNQLREDNIKWWRERANLDDIQNDMNAYGNLTKNCSGNNGQHEFCIPGKCRAPPATLPKPGRCYAGDTLIGNRCFKPCRGDLKPSGPFHCTTDPGDLKKLIIQTREWYDPIVDLDSPIIPIAPPYDNNKIYNVNDAVTKDGQTYIMIDGIGAPGYPPPRPTNWRPLEVYDNNKIYQLGDVVTKDGKNYRMIDGIGAPGYPPPRENNWRAI
jgi:hypothetical protein